MKSTLTSDWVAPLKPVESLAYPDIAAPAESKKSEAEQPTGPSPAEIQQMLQRARLEAAADAERRLRNEFEEKLAREATQIKNALELFAQERRSYFARVEGEIVRLSLSIAAKILHREAQVDPMLVAALVRIAVERLHDGSSVSVRVLPQQAERWRKFFGEGLNGTTVAIVEDVQLNPGDCILETELGSANFSLDAQLKEIEQGFFDLLAQRPA